LSDVYSLPINSGVGPEEGIDAREHDAASDVAVPALKPGEEKLDEGDMGAIAIFLLLAARLDPHAALDGIDSWDGDAYVGFERDGRACVRVAIAAVDAPAAGRLDQLLTEWAEAVPDASAAVSRDDASVTFESCDPGVDTGSASAVADTALALPVLRTEIALEVARRCVSCARPLPFRSDRQRVLGRRSPCGRSCPVPKRRVLPAGSRVRPEVPRGVTRGRWYRLVGSEGSRGWR
jgi:hypothetical protein